MASIRIEGFTFIVYSNDHNPPHVHVRKGAGKMKITLGDDKTPPRPSDANRHLSDRDAAKAFLLCCENHERMVKLWERVHGEI
jgi:hypothetical protein